MTARTATLPLLAVVAAFALSGCSPSGDAGAEADAPAQSSGGSIELAVSETCVEGSSPDCVLVNGGYIAMPASFERAGVERALASVGGQHSVSVTFDSDGAAVFTSLAEEAVNGGEPARMLLRIGGEVKAAVSVVEVPQTPHMEILFAPEEDVDRLVELIREG